MATYVQEHMLLQWGGSFAPDTSSPATDEFVGGLRFAGPGLATADTDIGVQRMAAALAAFWKRNDNFIPYTARLGWVKWNLIGTNGKYVHNTQTRLYTYPTSQVSTNAVTYPQQVALGISWLTDIQRGKGSRGRTYFPTSAPGDPSIGMRIKSDVATAIATTYAGLISRLNFAASNIANPTPPDYTAGTPGSPAQDVAIRAVIMSPSGTGAGFIKRARVGDRLDIQRRRDNDVEETYTSAPI